MTLSSKPTFYSHLEEIGLHIAAHEFHKMKEPKIIKLKGGYTSAAGLIFQSWLKDIHVHVEDTQLTQREAIQSVKDFTAEHAQNGEEFYTSIVIEEDYSFKGPKEHLHDTFHSAKTLNKLVSDFYSWSQKTGETKDTFADNMQVLARKSLHITHLSI